ncbi:hypothetical protein ECC02_003306 [Trypanosoma cruzi]|uniref:t-SNARE coiled-coil homology domain-containing protein n=1 Tax=Trypanosoma cruzi TaxID=5693 RepID=A0A7J6Y9Z2_TRYCR|nr:hypothetical protein ECC02_003306 [Trypanosoma cruzi]
MRRVERSSRGEGEDTLATGEANVRTDTTVDVLRRASRHAQGAIETSWMTTRRLQVQGEQLEEIDRALDKMEHDLGVGDDALRRMTWTGRVKRWFTSRRKQPSDGVESSTSSSVPSSSLPIKPQGLREKNQQREGTRGSKRDDVIGCSSSTSHIAMEEEKLLDALLGDVHAMREQATLQGAMLTEHNRRLDVIATKTDAVHNHVNRTKQKVEKML